MLHLSIMSKALDRSMFGLFISVSAQCALGYSRDAPLGVPGSVSETQTSSFNRLSIKPPSLQC